jgi:hypothetical protein
MPYTAYIRRLRSNTLESIIKTGSKSRFVQSHVKGLILKIKQNGFSTKRKWLSAPDVSRQLEMFSMRSGNNRTPI